MERKHLDAQGRSPTCARAARSSGRKPPEVPAYLWCTALPVTPRRAAICCQDQPLARAFSTCKASSTSTRPRRAATAASPTSGSWLLVAAATWVTSPGGFRLTHDVNLH